VKANYDGECSHCRRFYDHGDDIVAIPPRGKRRRWLKYHRACHQAISRGVSRSPVAVRFECPRCGGAHHRDDCRNQSSAP
jgi:predicted RNA-binding Zn-ribbon protein involved in translation (DUF1610 family)